MPIDTNFAFHHRGPFSARSAGAPIPSDLLGSLSGLVQGQHQLKWAGTGFNLIWRPQFGAAKDFFLQLMFTSETLEFTNISGTGIANRGFRQQDVFLGGVAYLQQIKDAFDGSDQHFEPGVWSHIPRTTDPSEPETVARMGSIPHGTTINLQGTAAPLSNMDMSVELVPTFIKPFSIGSADDGQTGTIPGAFDAEQTLSATDVARTNLAQVSGLTQEQLTNPHRILDAANAGLTFDSIVRIQVSSDTTVAGSVPDAGGGTDSIAFLRGKGTGNQNADAPTVSATFWLQDGADASGQRIRQIQYTQRVLLNFNNLSWPHISVGTLRPAP